MALLINKSRKYGGKAKNQGRGLGARIIVLLPQLSDDGADFLKRGKRNRLLRTDRLTAAAADSTQKRIGHLGAAILRIPNIHAVWAKDQAVAAAITLICINRRIPWNLSSRDSFKRHGYSLFFLSALLPMIRIYDRQKNTHIVKGLDRLFPEYLGLGGLQSTGFFLLNPALNFPSGRDPPGAFDLTVDD